MKKAAIYLRVSTAQQAQEDRTSIPEQRRLLTEIAERQGWAFDEFEEVGSAGDGAAGLPVLTEVLGKITMGTYSKLLVYHLDRLSRAGVGEGERIKAILATADCEIVTPGGKYDPRNEGDDLRSDVEWMFAKQEHRRIFHRTYQGKEALARKGEGMMGHKVPYGYRLTYSPEGAKRIEVVPTEAAAIRRAYELFLSGIGGVDTVTAKLRAEGFTARQGRRLASVSVRYWLANPRYAGQEFRRAAHTSWAKVKRKFSRETETVMAASQVWPAIITLDEWAAAQELQRLRTEKRRRTPRSPLGGVLICEDCDGPMDGALHSSGIYIYRCRARMASKGCKGPFYRGDEVHFAVFRWIRKFLSVGFPTHKAVPTKPDERPAIEAAIAEVKKAEDRLMDALLKGILSDEQVARKNAELRAEREALVKRLNATPVRQAPKVMPSIPLSALDNIEPSIEDPLFRQLVRSLIAGVRIEIGPTRIARDKLGRKLQRKTYRVIEVITISGEIWQLR